MIPGAPEGFQEPSPHRHVDADSLCQDYFFAHPSIEPSPDLEGRSVDYPVAGLRSGRFDFSGQQ